MVCIGNVSDRSYRIERPFHTEQRPLELRFWIAVGPIRLAQTRSERVATVAHVTGTTWSVEEAPEA